VGCVPEKIVESEVDQWILKLGHVDKTISKSCFFRMQRSNFKPK
jgi:hypothetical protein